jgi:hypothetical protein
MRVCRSAPARSHDLAGRRQRARVYEEVIVEGVKQDLRQIIDVDELVALSDEVYLPDQVRRASEDRLRERRGIELPYGPPNVAALRRHFRWTGVFELAREKGAGFNVARCLEAVEGRVTAASGGFRSPLAHEQVSTPLELATGLPGDQLVAADRSPVAARRSVVPASPRADAGVQGGSWDP